MNLPFIFFCGDICFCTALAEAANKALYPFINQCMHTRVSVHSPGRTVLEKLGIPGSAAAT